jgi:hypothetical protein
MNTWKVQPWVGEIELMDRFIKDLKTWDYFLPDEAGEQRNPANPFAN